MKTFQPKSRADWRAWLEKNHAACREVWLVHYRAPTGKRTVSVAESVEEALCFGWIDSIVRKLDAERYAQKFTPRRAGSRWSALNRRRAKKLVAAGLMTPAGMARLKGVNLNQIEAPAKRGARKPRPPLRVPSDLRRAIVANRKAKQMFDSLAPSYRRRYVGWVLAAKRRETRLRRVRESVQILAAGVKNLIK